MANSDNELYCNNKCQEHNYWQICLFSRSIPSSRFMRCILCCLVSCKFDILLGFCFQFVFTDFQNVTVNSIDALNRLHEKNVFFSSLLFITLQLPK